MDSKGIIGTIAQLDDVRRADNGWKLEHYNRGS